MTFIHSRYQDDHPATAEDFILVGMPSKCTTADEIMADFLEITVMEQSLVEPLPESPPKDLIIPEHSL